MGGERWFDRKVLSWTLYDWANSAFATSVMGVFFPIFFRKYWHEAGTDSELITFHLGVASSIASVVIVVLAPVLGSIADRTTARKKFLLLFAAVGVSMTAALPLVAQGEWLMAAIFYVLASIGFMGGNTFYDSLIVEVAPEEKLDLISGLGFGIGYLGGGLLLAFHFVMLNFPDFFGFTDKVLPVKIAIGTVAVWWAVFSVPLFLFVKETHSQKEPEGSVIAAGFRDLVTTFREIRQLKNTALFLLAYWFYIDGVDTVIRMAADYGAAIEGVEQADLLTAFLITQFVGFPSAIAFGKLGERIGTRVGIYIGIFGYIGICSYGYFVDTRQDFYVIAVCVGLVQGGIQSLSRSMYTRLVPPSRTGEFFGFYNMLGKFAAVLGPLLMGVVALVLDSRQLSIVSIIILFVIGALIFRKVDEAEGQRAAIAYDQETSG
jgi:UMF1 family MFS transporter